MCPPYRIQFRRRRPQPNNAVQRTAEFRGGRAAIALGGDAVALVGRR